MSVLEVIAVGTALTVAVILLLCLRVFEVLRRNSGQFDWDSDHEAYPRPLERESDILLLRDGNREPNIYKASYEKVCFSHEGRVEAEALESIQKAVIFNKQTPITPEMMSMAIRLCMCANNLILNTGDVSCTPLPHYLDGHRCVLFSNILGRREALGEIVYPKINPEMPIIFFRGTTSTRDWIEDLRMNLVPLQLRASTLSPETTVGNAMVHSGFQDAYLGVNVKMKEFINKMQTVLRPSVTQFLIVGHSLGGGLATLAALDLVLWSNRRIQVTVVTCGSPRAGNIEMCQLYNRLVPRTTRCANTLDPVVNEPPTFMGYAHVWSELEMTVSPSAAGLPPDNGPHSLYAYLYGFVPYGEEFQTHEYSMTKGRDWVQV